MMVTSFPEMGRKGGGFIGTPLFLSRERKKTLAENQILQCVELQLNAEEERLHTKGISVFHCFDRSK